MEIYAKDEGRWGVRIEVDCDRPTSACPGLGGWKRSENGSAWWTRVKGEPANRLARAIGEHGSFLKIQLDCERITDIQPD